MTIQPSPPRPDQNSRVAFRLDLVTAWRAEAGRADTKTGIVGAGLLTALTVVATSPAPTNPVALSLWWAGLALGLAVLAILGAAIYPEIPPPGPAGPRSIQHPWDAGDADRLGTPESLDDALDRTVRQLDDALDRTVRQLGDATQQVRIMARIVRDGYAATRTGMRLIPAVALLLATAAVIQAVTR